MAAPAPSGSLRPAASSQRSLRGGGALAAAAATAGIDDWEVTPLSGDHPFFTTVMSKSHVQKQFQLVIPARLHRHLPEALLCRGRSWAASYCGDLKCKKIDAAWRDFALDNALRVGDACVFELTTPAAGTGNERPEGREEVVLPGAGAPRRPAGGDHLQGRHPRRAPCHRGLEPLPLNTNVAVV